MQFDSLRPIDVISMGRVEVDLYAEQIGAPLKEVESFKKYLGGSAGNIAVGCVRQGLSVSMLSCVGKDEMGAYLLDALVREGIDVSMVKRSSEHLTGLVLLGINPPHNFPLMFYRENCADMQIDISQIDSVQMARAKALVIPATRLSQDHSRCVTAHAAVMAKKMDTRVILDLDYRPVLWDLTAKGNGENRFIASHQVTEVYQHFLPHCDLIVGTEEEFKIAGGSQNLTTSLQCIERISEADLVVKKGSNGCQVYTGNRVLNSAAFPVQALNVLGSGDAFISGLLGQLLKGYNWQQAMNHANACGAIAVTRHGCSEAIPYSEEVNYFIEHVQNKKPDDVIQDSAFQNLHNLFNGTSDKEAVHG